MRSDVVETGEGVQEAESEKEGEMPAGSDSYIADFAEKQVPLPLPVGPVPRGGRSEGGRLRAWRRREFSSSKTCTRDSKASRWAARRARKARWTSRARLGGRLSLRFRPRLELIVGDGGGGGGAEGEEEEVYDDERGPRKDKCETLKGALEIISTREIA